MWSKETLPEDQPELIDFLYRDSSRLSSLYAQLFGGLLATRERSTLKRSGDEKQAGFGLPTIAAGQLKTFQDSTDGDKQTVNPHDTAVIETLDKLRELGLIERLPAGANGALVEANGAIVFFDREVFRAVGLAMRDSKAKKEIASTTQETIALQLSAKAAESITMSSFFLLESDYVRVAGCVKESGMEEPIPSYYFRHGASGLEDVTVIGIREIAQEESQWTQSKASLRKSGADAIKKLGAVLIPEDAYRVTPIVIYRRVSVPRVLPPHVAEMPDLLE